MTSRSDRAIDYDQIAQLYDSQPYRQKTADPYLLAFMRERGPQQAPLALLDLGCGTGNQLLANRALVPGARMVGLDLSQGMLAQARRKAPALLWVRADSSQPPFADQSFDFISNQFSYHHVSDKAGMCRAIVRLLRPGGRFVLSNIAPHAMPGSLYYHYFPEAWTLDLADFLEPEALVALLRQAGFVAIRCDLQRMAPTQRLEAFLETAQRRDTCSQLLAISDAAYAAGLQRIHADLRRGLQELRNEVALLTIQADKEE